MSVPSTASIENSMNNTRLAVARALTQIVKHHRTIEWVRVERPQWLASPLQRELLYGTLRHYLSLSQTINQQLKKPLKTKDVDLHHVLLVGAYQLIYTGTADYAAINECVSACKALGKPWATGLVNGVLRTVQRQRQDPPNITEVDTAFADHPAWMTNKLTEQYGSSAEPLLLANNQRGPMTLRINTNAVDCGTYKDHLRDMGIGFDQGPWPETIVLHAPQTAAQLPGWEQGHCAVQDMAAQHAAHLVVENLPVNPGLAEPIRILDACAAPGGKLFHLYETLSKLGVRCEIHALDSSRGRLEDLAAIAARLGHKTRTSSQTEDASAIVLHCGDGTSSSLPFHHPFDVILIDAPCSGSGTIRRNPDIRLLLDETALQAQQDLQLSLIQNLWQHTKPGGSLLYSTCSVFAEENDQVIYRLLEQTASASVKPLHLNYGSQTDHGWQLLPTHAWTDGFYYCALEKAPTT